MTWAIATTGRSEQIRLNDLVDLAELRRSLDRRADTRPIIVTFESPSCRVTLGLAGDLGFVQGHSAHGDPPYRVSVSIGSGKGVVSFFLHGEHHTEIPARHLISISDAWAAAATLLDTGAYLPLIKWDEV
jgi:hypothetical protein